MLFDREAYLNLVKNILCEVDGLSEYDKGQVTKILQTTMESKAISEAYVCGVLISFIDNSIGPKNLESFDFKQSRYAYDVLSTAVDCIMMVL